MRVSVVSLWMGLLGLCSWVPAAAQDTVAPEVTMTANGGSLVDQAAFATAVVIEVSATDPSGIESVVITLDGGPFVSGASVATEGSHLLEVVARDTVGNEVALSRSFAIDTTPPVIVIAAPEPELVTRDGAVVVTGSAVGAVEVRVAGHPAGLEGDQFVSAPVALSEGTNPIAVVALDGVGNETSQSLAVVRDTVAPTLAVTSPADGFLAATNTVAVTGTAGDATLLEVTANGQVAVISGGSFAATGVPVVEGSSTITISAVDRAGNVTSATRAVVVDTLAPILAVTTPGPGSVTSAADVQVAGTAADPHLAGVTVAGVPASLAGSAFSATVPLTPGTNSLEVVAIDSLGHSSVRTATVLHDPLAPAVAITTPTPGARLRTASTTIAGTADGASALTVTVNGVAASLTGASFEATGVELDEGTNRIVARAVDAEDRHGVAVMEVVRDSVAPRLLGADPAGDSTGIATSAWFELSFSEALAAPPAGSVVLTATPGGVLPIAVEHAAEQLRIIPSSPLPGGAALTLQLTGAIEDLAGNPLPVTDLGYQVLDAAAPGAPVVTPMPAARVCADPLTLTGTAAASTRIEVGGGAGLAEATAGSGGAFAVDVPLVPSALNHLTVVAIDAEGDRSAATQINVIHDCDAPSVTAAGRNGSSVTVSFSEAMDAVSLLQPGAVVLRDAGGDLARDLQIASGGLGLTATLAAPMSGALELVVNLTARDLAGNPLAFAYRRTFADAAAPPDAFVAGGVLDAATGRPLVGARVSVVASNGVVLSDPLPQQVTGADGRFQIAVPAGTHHLVFTAEGRAPAWRIAVADSGAGTEVLDPRLEPIGAGSSIGTAGGALEAGAASVSVPAGALAATTTAELALQGEQALPALLPFGWSPRGAMWLDLGGAALTAPVTVELPVTAGPAEQLWLAALDLATLQWFALEPVTAADGLVTFEITTDGAFAVVVADTGADAPTAPLAGQPLASSPTPDPALVISADLTFDPPAVYPGQAALATVSWTPSAPVASGLVLELQVSEELDLIDGGTRREAPWTTDLVLYHEPNGTPRSQFAIAPSEVASATLIAGGREDLLVRHAEATTVRGDVIGPAGGVVATLEGDRVELPVGAAAEPIAVSLARRPLEALTAPVPAGAGLLGILELGLGGAALQQPARLSLTSDQSFDAEARGLLLQELVVAGTPALRVIAALVPSAGVTGTTWSSADIDPEDLALPGVRHGGLYVFVELAADIGWFRGVVLEADTAPANALLTASLVEWLQQTNADGRYALPSFLGSVDLVATGVTSGNTASAATSMPAADARVDLDLQLGVNGPEVVSITPAAGSTGVIPGIEPTIRFSEAIDPATITNGGVRLTHQGQAVAANVSVSDDLVTISPQATLLPGHGYEIRLASTVRDLQGYALGGTVTSTFTVRSFDAAGAGINRSRIHAIAPDANGIARAVGRPGAVPPGSLVFVENTTSLSSTQSVDAVADGSFQLSIPATLSDVLVLHIVPPGQNETILTLTPFQIADLSGAWVGNEALEFTTAQGLTVTVEEGTFLEPTLLTLTPAEIGSGPTETPAGFTVLTEFVLDLGGAVAQKALQITYDGLPAGDGELLLNQLMRAGDTQGWMAVDRLVRIPGSGAATTAPWLGDAAPDKAGSHGFETIETPWGPARVPVVDKAGSAPKQAGGFLPGSALPGRYQLIESDFPLGFLSVPFVRGLELAIHNENTRMLTVINASIERLLAYDAVWIPTWLGQSARLRIEDLATGWSLFDDILPPPSSPGGVVTLDPDLYRDGIPPLPIAGSPLRFALIEVSNGPKREVLPGVSAELIGSTLTLTGEDGSGFPGGAVRLVALEGAASTTSDTVASDGSFVLTRGGVDPGDRLVLAIGGVVAAAEPIELVFNQAVGGGGAGIRVRSTGCAAPGESGWVAATVEPVGTWSRVRLVPEPSWDTSADLHLCLLPTLVDGGGTSWDRLLDLPFEVEKSTVLGTMAGIPNVRDMARMGAWMFLAADGQGLAIVDVSNPAAPRSVVESGGEPVTWPLPYGDAVRGVATDPHGRVIIAGGGNALPGVLWAFDPLALDPAAAATAHEIGDSDEKYAPFRGSTMISDRLLPDPGTQLPEGQPRRVTVLSDDDTTSWAAGTTPASVSFSVVSTPIGGTGELRLSVAGPDGTPEAPVTLRNASRGRFVRVDAGLAGQYQLEITALPGDRIELLRNRRSIAYVSLAGVGVAVADVNGFWHSDNEPGGAYASTVLGYYTGWDGENETASLSLCDQPVSDLGAALLDIEPMFDPRGVNAEGGDRAHPHPLSIAGLVGFRGVVVLESDPNDVGEITSLGDLCADVAGSRQVAAFEVLVDYPRDDDRNGFLDAKERELDTVLVAHRRAGLLVFDLTERRDGYMVARVPLPAGAFASNLGVDRVRGLVYVTGLDGKIYVVDPFGRAGATPAARIELIDSDRNGLDDRIVETIELGAGVRNAPVLLAPELGLAWAGGLDSGLTAVAVGSPRLTAVAQAADGRWRNVDALAPLGVPNRTEDPLAASFRVAAALPGAAGLSFKLAVEARGPGGVVIDGAGDPAQLPGLPPTALAGSESLVLRRQASNAWEEGYQLYLSDEVVAVADLRAAKDYQRTAAENEQCERCVRSEVGVGAQAKELLSSDIIAVGTDANSALGALYRPVGAPAEPSARLANLLLEIPSVRWDISPSLRQEPLRNPSLGSGEVAPGTLLHSGEFTHDVTDLFVKGVGIDFAFTRSYRNQTVGSGPLGPGWDHGYRIRLRELPNGDVELYDGRGRRETFEDRGPDGTGDGQYQAPDGRFAELIKSTAGYRLVESNHTTFRFDTHGRLVTIEDPLRTTKERGNTIRFVYDAKSRLVDVVDDLDRGYRLTYDDQGRLATVTDFGGREVAFSYDPAGRLTSARSPRVTTGHSSFPDGITTGFDYAAAGSGDLATRLARRDNLTALREGRGLTWLEIGWGNDEGGRDEAVGTQTWGGFPLSVAYDWSGRETVVTDRRQNAWRALHNATGQPLQYHVPTELGATAVTSSTYDAEGLLLQASMPLGRTAQFEYDRSAGRRAAGNLLRSTVVPDVRGSNGSSPSLISTFEYDSRTNRVTRSVSPRGTITEIDRDEWGQAIVSREAVGTPAASTTTNEYDIRGRLLRITDGRGRVTEHRYFAEGIGRGYLELTTIDPGGLGLSTRLETDTRGNVTASIDPRGVRHESLYNELDWLVEVRSATTGSSDGAPALGHSTAFLYDAAGQRIEARIPYGDGSSFTRTTTTYGILGEATSASREVEPGGSLVSTSFEYDANFNRTTSSDPEGHVTSTAYGPRNLPVSVTGAHGSAFAATEYLSYDLEGSVVSRMNPRGYLTTVGYDGYGRVARTTDAIGTVTRTAYDNAGSPTGTSTTDAGEVLLASSRTTYDAAGRAIEEASSWWGPGDAAPIEVVARTEHDAVGNVIRRIDPKNRVTSFEYDGAHRRVATLDPAGNRTELTLNAAGLATEVRIIEVLPEGGTATVSMSTSYDALGRGVEMRDQLGNTTRSAYDARGNAIRVEDAEGFETTQTFDGLDRVTSITRPAGIRIEYEYDEDSRTTAYRDALGNETRWEYDDLHRVSAVHYPDATSKTFGHDAAGNVVSILDPLGRTIAQSFDPMNRLSARSVTPAEGEALVGPNSESFGYDGLGRLTSATSGGVTSALEYDSLSRLVAETTSGRRISYTLDELGNPVALAYPSGHELPVSYDALNRPTAVGEAMSYTYQGPGLVSGRSWGNGAVGSTGYDQARRPTSMSVTAGGFGAFGEQIAWSPRGLKSAMSRTDLNGRGLALANDPAGRLVAAARVASPAEQVPNNSAAPVSLLAGSEERYGFSYDSAENLVERREARAAIEAATALPVDGSGRNRPGAVGDEALSWDANGNLVGRIGQTLIYDFRDRLTEVRGTAGELVASYTYDAFNRRVSRTVGGETRQTAWSGWRPVEEYVGGQLAERRTYGLGIDELVRVEADLTGDGQLDTEWTPVYDSSGNVAVVLGEDGRVLERYEHGPYGDRKVFVDLTPPRVEQVRVVGGQIWLEVSEEVSAEALGAAWQGGALRVAGAVGELPLSIASVTQPIDDGPQRGRRVVLTLAEEPVESTSLTLTVEPAALRDFFGNVPPGAGTWTFEWPAGDVVVQDATAPRVERVVVRAGRLELMLSEEGDLGSAAAAIAVTGVTPAWELLEDRYTLRTEAALVPGAYQLSIGTEALDLAGLGLAQSFVLGVEIGAADQIVWEAPDPREVEASAVGNRFAFHGRELDGETGLVYFRNRYYAPDMGRFVSADPLGYVDGPSMYVFGGNGPVDRGDPLGLYEEDVHNYLTAYLALHAGFTFEEATAIGVETFRLDLDGRSAIVQGGPPLPNGDMMRAFHFVSWDRISELRDRAFEGIGVGSLNARTLGEFLHALEDTYAHQDGELVRGFGAYHQGPIPVLIDVGHGAQGHKPDFTWERPHLVLEAAREVYRFLVAACGRYRGERCDSAEFGSLTGTIWRFAVAKPPMFLEMFAGVPLVPSVRDYSEKIRILHRNFVLTPDERSERERKVREYDAFLARRQARVERHGGRGVK